MVRMLKKQRNVTTHILKIRYTQIKCKTNVAHIYNNYTTLDTNTISAFCKMTYTLFLQATLQMKMYCFIIGPLLVIYIMTMTMNFTFEIKTTNVLLKLKLLM